MADLTVSFGANLSDLNAALNQAAANTKAFSGSLATAAAAPNASFAALKTSLDTVNSSIAQNNAAAAQSKTTWLDVAGGVVAAETALTAFNLGLRGIASVTLTPLTLAAQSMKEIGKIPGELARFPEDLKAAGQAIIAFGATLLSAGASLFSFDESFKRGVVVIQQFVRGLEIYRSGLLATEGATIAAAGNMSRLQEAAKQMGFENATRLLQQFTTQLTLIPGMSNEAAAGIVSTLGSITNFSGQATQAIIDILPKLAKSADDAKKLSDWIANAFANPASNGKQFLATLGGVSAQLQEQFAAAVQTGNVNREQAVLYDALIAKIRQIASGRTTLLQNEREELGVLTTISDFIGGSIGQRTADLEKTNSKLEEGLNILQRQADAIRSLPQSSTQVFTAAQPIISNARPQIDQVEELTRKLEVLYEEKQRLQTGGSPFGGLATPETARELERNKEATDALEDSLRKLQDARKGGSAVELLENAQAQASAKFTLDKSAAALALAQTLDQEAASTKNLAEANRLAKQAAEEREKGLKFAADENVAQFKRQAAAANSGSAEELAATLKANAAKRAVTPPGAERTNLDTADDAAEKKRQDTLDADAKAGEDARYKIKQDGLASAVQLIREEAQEGKITHETERAELLENLKAQEAAQREHLGIIIDIFDEGDTEYRDAQRKLTATQAEFALKRVAAERSVDQQIAAAQKQAIDQTASVFSTAITGMITHQTSLADAAKNIAKQMLSTYVDLAMKMVLNNSGAIGQMVAQTVTGEGAKTSTTVAGVGARTSAETAGSAAVSAGTITSVLASIKASAAEAFAGVVGFLSPILGPAAVGPGLATEGTVLAAGAGIARFAAGAWSLPADMVAQVHQGEMIVPAGPAAAMRGALSGGQGGGGGNTVHVHNAMNFNSPDAEGVKRLFENNDRALLKAVDRAMRHGVHLGLAKLT